MLGAPSEVQVGDPVRFPLGLNNSASIYQDSISYLMQSEQEIPLAGAQAGLVLSITFEGRIVHWPGAWPNISSTDPSHLVGMVELLPYQDGSTCNTPVLCLHLGTANHAYHASSSNQIIHA